MPTNKMLASRTGGKDFLTRPIANVNEIIFACRQLNYDGHWYANFGYYADSAKRKAYRAMGRLCKLNIRTGQLTILLDDPEVERAAFAAQPSHRGSPCRGE